MDRKTRQRLSKISKLLAEIPFSASGTATSTGFGAIMFEQDMRAIRPYILKVLEGMALEGVMGLEVGYDYEHPDLLLDALMAWLAQRKTQGWQNTNDYSFAPL